MRHLLSILFLLFFSVQLSAQVLINEFSSSNISGITDEDGDHSDWIELYNSSALAANLEGYYLSDNAHNLKKWTLPAISLKPDNFLLIFASGKNRTEIPLSFQTIIQKGSDWQYIVPSSEIGSSWRNTSVATVRADNPNLRAASVIPTATTVSLFCMMVHVLSCPCAVYSHIVYYTRKHWEKYD